MSGRSKNSHVFYNSHRTLPIEKPWFWQSGRALKHWLFGWSPLWLPLYSWVHGFLQLIMWKSAASIQPITLSCILWNWQKWRINTIQFLEGIVTYQEQEGSGTLVYFISLVHRSKGISCNKMKYILCTNKIWYNAFHCINGNSVLRPCLSTVLFRSQYNNVLTSPPVPGSLQKCDNIWSCQMEMAVHWR